MAAHGYLVNMKQTVNVASGRLQPCAAASVDAFSNKLELWQLEKLSAAFAVGRKNVKITEVAIEAELPRADVLAWLRKMEKAPEEVRNRLLTTRLEALRAAKQRKDLLAERTRAAEPALPQQGEPEEERWRIARGDPYVDHNAPWKANYGRKRLSRAAEATLNRVFEQARFPNDAVLDSIWDLHRVPRRRAMQWFAARREASVARVAPPSRQPEEDVEWAGAGAPPQRPADCRAAPPPAGDAEGSGHGRPRGVAGRGERGRSGRRGQARQRDRGEGKLQAPQGWWEA